MGVGGFKAIFWDIELFITVLKLGSLAASMLCASNWPIFTKNLLKELFYGDCLCLSRAGDKKASLFYEN